MRANSDESFIDNPILITGILPLLPGARSLSSAVFLAATLLIVSMALQVLSAILGRILNPWPWKTCMIFFASVFVSIMLKLTGILDRHAAMAIADVVALFLFSGVMRIQYRAWSEDIGHGVYYQISRIIPAIAAALILVAFGALREILEAGRLTLPAFGGAQSVVSVPPFSMLPSSVLAMSAGAFLIAGYATVVLRLVGRRKRKEGRPS